MSVVVDSIRIDRGSSPRLTVSGIEIAGRTSLRSFPRGWTGTFPDGGSIWTRTAASSPPAEPNAPLLVIEQAVRDGRLEVELRAIRWRARLVTGKRN